MAIQIPESAIELTNKSKVDVQRELSNSDPFLKNSWLGALVTSFSNRVYDFYYVLSQAFLESIPDTAKTNAARWASIWGITTRAATQSNGTLVAIGTAGATIPTGTAIADTLLSSFTTTGTATIATSSVTVTLARVGSTVTATSAGNHDLANNVPVTIAGASPSDYNVTDTAITVNSATTFTYEISTTPSGASGTITATGTFASVPVQSDEFGTKQNKAAGSIATLQIQIANINESLTADYFGITGGVDQELDADRLERLLYVIRNPVSGFNVSQISTTAKTVPGVTRVFVSEASPAAGQCQIYLMADNNTPTTPSATMLASANALIQALRPAQTAEADVFVLAPVAVPTDFVFSALNPDTATMRTSITNNLAQFFEERPLVSEAIAEDAYRSAIYNTVDTGTGNVVVSFTLTSPPSGAISIAAGQIGTLGSVTF